MDCDRIRELHDLYRRELLSNVIQFWLKHSQDREYGGYLTCLDRDGTVFGTDKPVWTHGRAIWIYSKLYNTVEPRDEWLEAAERGYRFLTEHCFDADGRLFFRVTRDGRPLIKRRYLFSEAFAVIACAEYSRATGDGDALQRAKDTYRLMLRLHRTPGALPPKVIPETRVTKAHAMPMILLSITQELRQADSDELYTQVADQALDEILNHFAKRDEQALLEIVGPDGQRLDSPEGRLINPGHAIESAWFIMHESRHRNDPFLLERATEILDWSLDRGWDKRYGGILYFVDVEDKPLEQLEWDMKLWWPHTEALYALLLAHHLTGKSEYLDWYEKVHEWTFAHFPDPEYGEWFGYLHRDGTLANRLKGNMWKGPFHVPRALWLCTKLLEEMGANDQRG